jgi:hypothetical protein
MNHLARVGCVIAGLVVSVVGLMTAAPAAFAVRLAPAGSSGPVPRTIVAHAGGTSSCEVALLSVGVAIAAVIAAVAVVRVRRRLATRLAID